MTDRQIELPEQVPVKRQRGYVTIAHNSNNVDYVRHAYALALSLRGTQTDVPYLSLLVPPEMALPRNYVTAFDEVIVMQGQDLSGKDIWKVHNKWNAYFHSPYEETVLLDADMLFTHDVSWWWDTLSQRDVWACTDVLTYRNEPFTSSHYRKVFSANKLPNIYTAFMYFKRSKKAAELFIQAAEIINHWAGHCAAFLTKETPKMVSGDVAFALAMKLLDETDTFTRPGFGLPTFVHMRSNGQNWNVPVTESWTRHIASFVDNTGRIRIGNHLQVYPLHYQDKDFLTNEIISTMERVYGQ